MQRPSASEMLFQEVWAWTLETVFGICKEDRGSLSVQNLERREKAYLPAHSQTEKEVWVDGGANCRRALVRQRWPHEKQGQFKETRDSSISLSWTTPSMVSQFQNDCIQILAFKLITCERIKALSRNMLHMCVSQLSLTLTKITTNKLGEERFMLIDGFRGLVLWSSNATEETP